MSPTENLLQHLHSVKRCGAQRYLARCPAHEDKHPSLSIRETDDGRLLLKCWAGCSAAEVVSAVGLDMTALFPPRDRAAPGSGTAPARRPWLAVDLLQLAAFEASIVCIVAADLLAGRTADMDRLLTAAGRLGDMLAEVEHAR